MKKIKILDVAIDNVNFNEALSDICDLIRQKNPVFVVTPNIDHIVKIRHDAEFGKIYAEASLILADGMPLLWAAGFLGTPLKEKVSGADLFPNVCEIAAQNDYRLFFLGGREGAAAQAADILMNRYPGLNISGHYSPPFGFEEDPVENGRIIKMIKDAKPDILFVGLGAPKQEKWIYKHKNEYDVPVSIGIGASFEFIAGMVKRAPRWMQKCGLEWLWRLMMEPKRLWKRYLVEDMEFFWLIIRQKFFV